MAETSGVINLRDASRWSASGPRWKGAATVVPLPKNPHQQDELGSDHNDDGAEPGTETKGTPLWWASLQQPWAEMDRKVTLLEERLEARRKHPGSDRNDDGPGPTQATYSTASSAFPMPGLDPAQAPPSVDTIVDSTTSHPVSVPSVAPEPGPYDNQTHVQQPAETFMDESKAPSSPASVVSVDPNDYEPPDCEYQTQMTRANHHTRQAGFIYQTLLRKNQQLELELAACRKELEDFKQNRTSAPNPVALITEPPNKKARRDPTFTPASNDPSHSKPVSTNRNMVHSNPRCSSIVPKQEVGDDDAIPVPVAGIKRPYSDGRSLNELNISPRDPLSPTHLPSKYPCSNQSNKPTQEERNSMISLGEKDRTLVYEKYRDSDARNPVENYNSGREVQRPETSWSESIMQEAQHREIRGSVKLIVEHIEDNPLPNFNNELFKEQSKNMKSDGQSRSQLKFIPGPQPMNVDSEPSKCDAMIGVINTEPPSKRVRRQLRKARTTAKWAESQGPVATGTTLQRSEQPGIPVKRVCIEHSEIPGNGLWAFFSPTVPLFIRDGDKGLFNLSSWPLDSLDMEYTTGEDPTIQIKSYADDCSPRILTIRLHVENDAKGRYGNFFTRLKSVIPKARCVRDDKHLWQLAEMHSAQTASKSEFSNC